MNAVREQPDPSPEIQTKPAQVFSGDITGPDGSTIDVYTVANGSFDGLFGNFTLRYGAENVTWALPFDATAEEVEEALEVRHLALNIKWRVQCN